MKNYIKYIYITLFVVLTTNSIYSKPLEKYKAIEVSIGGSLTDSFVYLTSTIIFKSEEYNEVKYKFGEYYIHDSSRPQGLSISLNIPFSFIFYPVKPFGFGLNYSPGFEVLFNPAIIPLHPSILSFQNKIKFVNKIGNSLTENWFLLEYGINITLSNSPFLPQTFYHTGLYFGPCVFIGYERNFVNRLAFAIGFSFDSIFTDISQQENIWSYRANELDIEYYKDPIGTYDWLFLFGIETRIRFSFKKEFIKNNK